ncbi:RES family NAD+ phosphorylase [Acidisoma silvae]|uniref:RES domain-containing protein n=1 Tax=Acidisoma silvae TaxID=2802396 RepID=A0A964E0E1_9PROT|nr:RES domain-containing protein [Acidisoma silvae]MCB8877067.1 RES domain-containing protein [Acidisoma silvae]
MRFHGFVYRAHHPRWAFSPLSGEGAARYGGRFNPPGMPALYTARRMQTAWLEAQQAFPFKAQPMTLCAYEVDCVDVADLTNPITLGELGIAQAALACPWEDLASRRQPVASWDLARRLQAEGFAAILVPSFAAGATSEDANLVFWQWAADLPHRVTVIDDDNRLPRDDRSWRL